QERRHKHATGDTETTEAGPCSFGGTACGAGGRARPGSGRDTSRWESLEARISVRSWPCRRFAAPAESIQRAMLCELCACQPKLAGARRAKVGALRSKGFLSVSESLWWSVFVTFVPFVPSVCAVAAPR